VIVQEDYLEKEWKIEKPDHVLFGLDNERMIIKILTKND